ncbi:hypothetical protein B296_00058726 [Ensete ventricosum]|uniref:Uncharacterized protein n=1 Tax=Ensete ventricosum TaxID=4639 RepID=A0A426XKX6_ENSVE|nr:hypothetical protein B296_00058726 [Ensete ventricosum]
MDRASDGSRERRVAPNPRFFFFLFFSLFFFSLFFFLPPSADTAQNRSSTVEIDRYRLTTAGNGRNRPVPVDFGW